MAIVTFASPTLHRDVTVYATAGDTKTVLSLAEKNEVKIPHDCREGDCGSCLIEVKYLAGKPKMAIDLTDKEKSTLQSLGRITAAQNEDAEVNHVAPPHRLACQFIARDEDMVITFTGEPGGAD
jgi:ferredoxin